eukprot:65278-Pyramimonas_sp.AAC.1
MRGPHASSAEKASDEPGAGGERIMHACCAGSGRSEKIRRSTWLREVWRRSCENAIITLLAAQWRRWQARASMVIS